MIDLPLRIKTELSGATFSLNPLVVIDVNRIDSYANNQNTMQDSTEKIFISANKQSFPLQLDNNGNPKQNVFWHDRDLKLGSIKESIDINNKNFKINNVSITFSNDLIQNQRFSDIVSDKNIINKNIQIYYQTPSARSLENCILVYSGIVSKIRHDFKKFKIECEDLTQYKLSTKFPKANMGFGNHIVSDDYKNRPIPVVYGDVDKAPCLLMRKPTANTDQDYETFVICDDVLNDSRQINLSGFGGDTLEASFLLTDHNASCPLFIYKGDYYQVLKKYQDSVILADDLDDFGAWSNENQYTVVEDNYISIPTDYSVGLAAANPPAFGNLQTFIQRHPKDAIIAPTDPLGGGGLWNNITETEGVTIGNKQNILDSVYLESSQYITTNFDESASNSTYATVPDNSIEVVDIDDDWAITLGTKPVRWDNDRSLGLWLPKHFENHEFVDGYGEYDSKSFTNGQFIIAQHFFLYSHEMNATWTPSDEEDPPVEIKYMPSSKEIFFRTRKKVIVDFYYKDNQGTPFSEDDFDYLNPPNTIYYQSGNSYNSIDSDVLATSVWEPSAVPSSAREKLKNIMNAYPCATKKAFTQYVNACGINTDSDSNIAEELFSVNNKKRWSLKTGDGGSASNPMYPQGIYYRFQLDKTHFNSRFRTGSSVGYYNNYANMFVSVSFK